MVQYGKAKVEEKQKLPHPLDGVGKTLTFYARRPVPPYSFPPFHQLRTEPLSRETFVASSGRLAIANRAQG
jgi:hypothetical protein